MNISHLASLTDEYGLVEHCVGLEPIHEFGYCVDDVARALIVLTRSDHNEPSANRLVRCYSRFLADAQREDGRLVNRRDPHGVWIGQPDTGDHWGRAMWAWGTVISNSRDPERVATAFERFTRSAQRRSTHLRAMVFASLGAAEVLEVFPENRSATAILRNMVSMMEVEGNRYWPWPEPRLTYANGSIPQALMLAGLHLRRRELIRRGKTLLQWLLDLQTSGGHLSLIPHTGLSPGDSLPAFDQQPIEVSALVEACVTAYDVTSDPHWLQYVDMGRRWFDGDNDQGIPMCDPGRGAGFDALTSDGRNGNCGAESTLAYLAVEQQAMAAAGTYL